MTQRKAIIVAGAAGPEADANTVLQRFFLLSFTYKLNRMGGKNMPAQRVERTMIR